jgi:hypothetical protein
VTNSQRAGSRSKPVTIAEALAALEQLEGSLSVMQPTKSDIAASRRAQTVLNRYIRAHAEAVEFEREAIMAAQELKLTRRVLQALDEREKAGHREATAG